MPNKNIVLLVFALSEAAEVEHKPFLAKASLAAALQKHTRTIAEKSGLPVLYFDESNQHGPNFGARFANAMQHSYKQGYDAVIAIGSDCPHLQLHHLLRAKKALQEGKTVLGPTHDGGFYLLGLSKTEYRHHTFLKLSWNTDRIYDEVRAMLHHHQKEQLTLEKLRDLDFFAGLQKIALSRIKTRSLRKAVAKALQNDKTIFGLGPLKTSEIYNAAALNKGSPLSLPHF
ncbi:TIGR04282 family arsenosugar biosynthesis glycosyltransferase [Maribacter sp. 2-571]|uniref:TIGR04282 family arsenosugar biosynthesis glycosyltransferase n=1 Tax=Maribacter sp. 2-571 TaxID=3417569 RepID=UPI003D338A45